MFGVLALPRRATLHKIVLSRGGGKWDDVEQGRGRRSVFVRCRAAAMLATTVALVYLPTLAGSTSVTAAAGDVTVLVAGDIACLPGSTVTTKACHQQQTSDLLVSRNPDAVLALGDLQYQNATAADFAGSFAWSNLDLLAGQS